MTESSSLAQPLAQRDLRTSIILITNRGVASWGEILGDTAVAAAPPGDLGERHQGR